MLSRAMKMRKLLIFAVCAVSLASCRYPTTPDGVEIYVGTSPPDASCIVSRDGRTVGHIDQTPGIAFVPNEEADYLVSCKRNGFQDASGPVHARAVMPSVVEYFGGKSLRPTGGTSIAFVLTPR